MRIVFFGTPDFAVPSLQALLAERAQVVGVVTRPDKPKGRSWSTLLPSPVKQLADRHGLPVLQPERPTGDVFLAALRHWHPELGVVVAYGHLLRAEVIALPTRGMLNVHASLLPHLRGAAPINWAILQGDAETGVSIMQLDAGLDSGPVLRRAATRIGLNETAGELRERLAELGAETLIETLALLRLGRLAPEPQDPALATFAPKLDRKVRRIDWTETAAAVARRIRAFDPAPGAWATLEEQEVKLFGARVVEGDGRPGEVLDGPDTLRVATGRGVVEIAEVQPAGRGRMRAAAWRRGRGPRPGQLLA
ncbi:MAG TPA: methionyl-tRNA formyltransferase [Gemmatimonadales bacterium]|jgi:methionyl-tRNA formyltransferase|nr:methionyl-tRNA formyltransferase [Gemmatimonadales bacterium]